MSELGPNFIKLGSGEIMNMDYVGGVQLDLTVGAEAVYFTFGIGTGTSGSNAFLTMPFPGNSAAAQALFDKVQSYLQNKGLLTTL